MDTTTITIPAGTSPLVLRQIEGLLRAADAKPRPISCRLRQATDILAGTRHFYRQKAGGLGQRWAVGRAFPLIDLHCGTLPGHRTLSVPFSVIDNALSRGPAALAEPATMTETKAALKHWPELMTVANVADALNVGGGVVRSLIKAGLLTPRPGRLTLIHQNDLAEYYVRASRQAVEAWMEGQ